MLRPLLRPVMRKFDEATALPEAETRKKTTSGRASRSARTACRSSLKREEAPRERSYRANLALAKEMARDDPRIVANVIKAWVGSE